MIKVENLRKVFVSEDISIQTFALDGVSFEINKGEFVAIMGPSGCGKSTLLNILGLLDNPTEGSYELLGHQVGNLKEKDRTQFRKGNIGFVFQSFNLIDELNVFENKDRTQFRKGNIGFVFQSFNLIDELNVFENIELPLRYMNIPAAERKQRVDDIMTRMAIKHRKDHFPQQLSGGQQQRVAIARAVVANPKLILADEPTGNLDSKNGREVMDLLTDLHKEGTTIVMVTHSQRDAGFADRIINLFDGKIVEDVLSQL